MTEKTKERLVGTILIVVVLALLVVLFVSIRLAVRPKPCKETSEIIKIGPDSTDRARCEHEKHRIRVVPEEHWSYVRVYCVCK